VRALVLIAFVASALAMLLIGRFVTAPAPVEDHQQLSYVTTAHQLGVVGYRDPAGAISPDGTRFAYSEGRFIRVIPITGGAPITLAPGKGQIRYLNWRSNNTVMAQDSGADNPWWLYDVGTSERRELWGYTAANVFRQLTWKSDGTAVAGLVNAHDGPRLLIMPATGSNPQRTQLPGPVSFPAFMADGTVACIADARIMIPCGSDKQSFDPDVDVHGPIAFSADRAYFASPDTNGMVALWTADLRTKKAHRISWLSRDTYAPSIGGNTVVFKTQTYRTHLADISFEGGATRQLTTFQSETPSYHPTRPLIAFTYGTWRRVIDDAKYPDIAQEIGVVDVSQPVPAAKPSEVLEDSDSEDQAMTWSPNGKWIAFHSHKEMSDDVWLRSASAEATADRTADKRITFLGRGAEVGWPRWSPDGRTVLLNGARKRDGASVLYAIGVNQDTGATTSELREIAVTGVAGEMGHAEWMPDNRTVIATAKEGPGRHVIFTVPVGGGRATVVHRFATEHDFSGLGVSANGRFVAFVAPAPDGFFQIFVKTIGGATPPVQLTTDRSHKTQPTFSPDGARVAFTVWSYEAAFWSFKGR
jgi:hypothetical protein